MKFILIILTSALLFLLGCSTAPQKPSTQKKEPRTVVVKNPKITSQDLSLPILQQNLLGFRQALQANRWQQVIDISEVLLKDPQTNPAHLSELYAGRTKAFEVTEFFPNILLDTQNIMSNPSLAKEHEFYLKKSIHIIESKLSKSDLEKIADLSKNELLLAHGYYRLAQIHLDERSVDDAKKYFSKSYNQSPQSEIGKTAFEKLQQLEAARRVESKTIGVVLPLTGRFSAVSKKTLRGVQMGLGLYNGNYSNFKLAVVDSEGNPEGARRGVERLVKEDNVIAIIGSVLSRTSIGVAAKASELGVPSITLSQKSGVTDLSNNVFRNSLTSEMQVRHLVKTAMEDFGLKRFAVLYPNDNYGIEYTNIFWDEVLARGGKVTAAQVYSNKETDFRTVTQKLIGTYYLEDRADEYKHRLKEWSDAQTKKNARLTPPDDLLPPIVDFDAIFIPDGVKSLGQIAAMLSYHRVKDVKLIGTNLWNVPGIAKRSGLFSKSLIFVDSFSTSDSHYQSSAFVKEYKSIFNEEPGLFEIQAYDAALMLRNLIQNGNTSRESLADALAKIQNFPGAIGSLNMSPEREVIRPLVTLTVEGNEAQPYRKPVQ